MERTCRLATSKAGADATEDVPADALPMYLGTRHKAPLLLCACMTTKLHLVNCLCQQRLIASGNVTQL